jgi:hypothetical protein
MPKYFSVLFVALSFILTSSFAQISLHQESNVTPKQVDGSMALLYDQTAGGNTNGYAAQDFEASLDPYDCEIADDFTVPSPGWAIDQIVVYGSYSTGGPAAGFNVYFYANSAGTPGTQVYAGASQPYTFNGVDMFTVNLTVPAVLTPGTYWVSVQCRMDFTPNGQWYWNQVNGTYGSVAHWRNPGGGFGTTCATWGNIQTCIAAAGTAQNFALYGDVVPVELASFTASADYGVVNLNWSTATETNNQGFEVQRSESGEFVTIAFVEGHGTTTQTQNYSYTDRNVNVGAYSYRLKQVDFDGTFEYSGIVEVDVPAPAVFSLDQNYPNPFNPSTMISFRLAVDSKVSMTVFNVLGQEVASLLNGNLSAGSHQVTFDATSLNTGVYMYRIEAAGIDGTNFVDVKKMILTK